MRVKTKQQTYIDQQTVDNDVLLERINNLIDTNKTEHKTLIEQTTKTNGRVTHLEAWRNLIVGGLTILNVIVWPIVLYLITRNIK